MANIRIPRQVFQLHSLSSSLQSQKQPLDDSTDDYAEAESCDDQPFFGKDLALKAAARVRDGFLRRKIHSEFFRISESRRQQDVSMDSYPSVDFSLDLCFRVGRCNAISISFELCDLCPDFVDVSL